MAHSLSAQKRIRQSEKRRARNRWRKDQLKGKVKTFLGSLAAGDTTKAETDLNAATATLMRVAAKGAIHKNAAARKRSRLTKRLNAVKAGKLKGTAAAKA